MDSLLIEQTEEEKKEYKFDSKSFFSNNKAKPKNKNIEADDYSIESYICEDIKYIIPRYQRDYSWDIDNVKQLLKDIKVDYYLGNIIIYTKENSDIKEVVDGQQRLISIFLILLAIRNITDDNNLVENIDKFILHSVSSEIKLNIKGRAGAEDSNILELIVDNIEPTREQIKNQNEIKIYESIKKEFKTNEYDLDELFYKILNSKIVEIAFIDKEFSAHEMFVNVNTKGKPLSAIDVIKSQLFRFLLEDEHSDICKEKWQKMLKNISIKEYDNYVSDIYLFKTFLEEKTNKGANKTENYKKLLLKIENKIIAKDIFEFMTGEAQKDIYLVYSAVKNHDLTELAAKYYGLEELSISQLDMLWKMIGEYGFKQIDIFFTALLYNKKNFLKDYIIYISTLIKYLFMYEIIRSITGKSPSNYSNIFKNFAGKIYGLKDVNEIKKVIKEFAEEFKLDQSNSIKKEELSKKINQSDTFISNYKTAKFLIMLTEDIFATKLTSEHFIHQKTKIEGDKIFVGELGNIIPVIKDKYKSFGVKLKLEKYNCDKSSDKGIENFLKYEFDESNYKEKINTRTKDIASKFIDKYEELYKRIMEE